MTARLIIALAALVLAAPVEARAASSHVRIVDLATGAVTAQDQARSWSYLTWRPDGTLAATAGGHSVRAIPGGSIAGVRHAWSTALSPAGDRLATLTGDERLEIRALSGAVLARRRIHGSTNGLAWRRDGARLAVSWAARKDDHRITILGPRLEALRTFRVPEPASFSSAGWAPDGTSLAFMTKPAGGLLDGPVPREIRRLDLRTGRQTVLLRGTRCDRAPGFGICEPLDAPVVAPDGARVAFVRDLNAVTLLAPAALPAQMTPSPACDGVFDVAWAPDGASLLVAYVEADTMRLARLPATPMGGVTHVLADLGHTDVNNLTVSPDGTRAAFSGSSDIDF